MMLKRALIRAATAALLFAAMPLSSVNAVAASTPAAEAGAQRLANLKSKGATEIDRRLQNLAAANTKLTASTKLTPAGQDALTQQVQAQTASLTALKAKLAADADLAAARTDIQTIVTGYRTYALTLPQIRLAAAADRLGVVEAKLGALSVPLQTKLTAQKAAGQNTAALEARLATIQTKTAAAETKTAGLAAKIMALTPADYNASRATLLAAHESLRAAQADVKIALSEVKALVEALPTAP